VDFDVAGGVGVTLVTKKTANVRLSTEADRLAEIASGYTGESKAEYVSRVVAEAARRDITEGHVKLARELEQQPGPPTKATKARKPKGSSGEKEGQ
jgi:hypothetical protein